MPAAIHKNSQTAHGVPLAPGPGSGTVFIDDQPAFRPMTPGVGAGLASASAEIKALMDAQQLTPPQVAPKIGAIQQGLMQSAQDAAAKEGNGAGVGAVTAALATLTTTNVTLTAAFTAQSAAPGGQAAATTTYTQGFKAALTALANAAFAAVGGANDLATCAAPGATPHGPGVFVEGSSSVFIDDKPALHTGHKLIEATGGPTDVTDGSSVVFIDE